MHTCRNWPKRGRYAVQVRTCLFKGHDSKVPGPVKILRGGGDGIPGKVVFVIREVPAFVYVGPERSRKGEVRPEEAQEGKRDPI